MQMLLEKNCQIIQSPLNYTGGKFKLLAQILPLFPKKIDVFIDLFCGGANVGININSKKIILNDINYNLINLFKLFKNSQNDFLFLINEIIEKYHLSQSSIYGYSHYNCNSADGLALYNKNKYLKLREDFNNYKNIDNYYFTMLYVLIIYSFNNQIRFNKQGKFNLPVGKRDFNTKIQEKLKNFITNLKEKNYEFLNMDFRKFDIKNLTSNSFVYIDPPYLITCATYNEQGKWSEKDEKDLLQFLDKLNKNNIKFALSNVIHNKNKTNSILLEWLDKNKNIYKIKNLNHTYNNSNYQTKNKNSSTKEVLIINY